MKNKMLNNDNIKLNDTYTNRRRKRRMKDQIKRQFICKVETCEKSYG